MGRIGLGCSRLGSVLSSGNMRAAEALICDAVDCGIRLFDTADVYAQGDSERILGRVLRRTKTTDAVITSKAGFVLPAPSWALRAAKPVLRALASAHGGIRDAAKRRRAEGYAQDFTPTYLTRALDSSLHRLQRDRLDIFLLHSPPPDFANRDEIFLFAERQIRAGKIARFGVSCSGSAADLAWLTKEIVEVVQVPMGMGIAAEHRFLAACRERGVTVIAREVLNGLAVRNAAEVARVVCGILAWPEISAVLIGTTDIQHFRANMAALRSAWSPARPKTGAAAGSVPPFGHV